MTTSPWHWDLALTSGGWFLTPVPIVMRGWPSPRVVIIIHRLGDTLWHGAMRSGANTQRHLSWAVGSWSQITYSPGLISSKTFSCLKSFICKVQWEYGGMRLMNKNVTNVDPKHDDNDIADDTQWWWQCKHGPGPPVWSPVNWFSHQHSILRLWSNKQESAQKGSNSSSRFGQPQRLKSWHLFSKRGKYIVFCGGCIQRLRDGRMMQSWILWFWQFSCEWAWGNYFLLIHGINEVTSKRVA